MGAKEINGGDGVHLGGVAVTMPSQCGFSPDMDRELELLLECVKPTRPKGLNFYFGFVKGTSTGRLQPPALYIGSGQESADALLGQPFLSDHTAVKGPFR